jgi:hypothetical protein
MEKFSSLYRVWLLVYFSLASKLLQILGRGNKATNIRRENFGYGESIVLPEAFSQQCSS